MMPLPEVHIPPRFYAKRGPKVTVGIGMISKNGLYPGIMGDQIVLASDSQTTYPGGQKRLDAKKINVVHFANARILIAQSGNASLADKAIEILSKSAKAVEVKRPESVCEAVQNAVREIRRHLIEIHQGCDFSDAAWKRLFLEDNLFDLLFGFYIDKCPHMYSVNLDWCLAIPVKSFKAIGCGAALGEYLIKEYQAASPELEYPDIIAVSVVEKVIENIEACGKPVWVGIVRPLEESKWVGPTHPSAAKTPPHLQCDAFICRRELVDNIAEEIKRTEKSASFNNSKLRLNILKRISNRVGGMVYTDDDDGFRMLGFYKSNKHAAKVFEKLTLRKRKSRKLKRRSI